MVRPFQEYPLAVACGVGVDSVAMLVGMYNRGVRPDLILFADVGAEKPETYAYIPVLQAWLKKVGFPPLIVVKYQPKTAVYSTLEAQCLHTKMLPALAYGGKSCSIKYKRVPQDKYCLTWAPAVEVWKAGGKVVKAIGYDAGKADGRRSKIEDDEKYTYWYPLRDWGWDRERCKAEIRESGLPVPMKSACFMCPASKAHEIKWLAETHPDLLDRALAIERAAREKGFEGATKGLGRSFSWITVENDRRCSLPLFEAEPAGGLRGDDDGCSGYDDYGEEIPDEVLMAM